VNNSIGGAITKTAPLILFLLVWEWAGASDPRFQFLFASPSTTAEAFVVGIQSGELVRAAWITLAEVVVGLALGSVIGVILGVAIGLSFGAARIFEPYLIVLSSVPIFAIAPMTILWFGTGFLAKVMLVFLSTVFLAVFQSYSGVRAVDKELVLYFRSLGANRTHLVRHIVMPSALEWIISACRLNVGFAILGAFVAEFISSNDGLGHFILKSSGLYKVDAVLAGVFLLAVISLAINYLIKITERRILKWRY